MHKLVIAESQTRKERSLICYESQFAGKFVFPCRYWRGGGQSEWSERSKIEALSYELATEIAFWVVGFFSVSPTTLLSLRAFGGSRFPVHVAQILVVPRFVFHSEMIWLPCNLIGFSGKLLILIRIIHIPVSDYCSFSGRLWFH
jgi:hypothetical protein